MNDDLRDRLNNLSVTLHQRALALSHPGQDEDIATIMSSLAVIMEALRVLGEEINALRAE